MSMLPTLDSRDPLSDIREAPYDHEQFMQVQGFLRTLNPFPELVCRCAYNRTMILEKIQTEEVETLGIVCP